MNELIQYDERQRRASILLYALGIFLILLIANVPGWNEGFNRTAANVLSLAGLTSLGILWKFPWHRYNRNLIAVLGVSTVILLAFLQYFTGGAASPFNAFFFLIVLFSALYYPRWLALLMGLVASLASLTPLLYSDPSMSRTVRLVVLASTYMATVFVGNIMVRELVRRERARRGLEADLAEVGKLRDDLARANKLERRRAQQLQAVHDIGHEVMAILEPTTLCWRLAEALHKELHYPIVTVLLLDKLSKDLVLVAHVGLDISDKAVAEGQLRIPVGHGIVGYVAQNRRPFATGDVSSVAFYKDVGRVLIRSELAVPIEVGEELLGVLNVESQNADEFDELDVMSLEAVADHVAVALQNAETHARLAEQASTDMLTGVYNHRALMERIDEEVKRAVRYKQSLAVLFFDLDHFKHTNDTYGHQVGDSVLHEVAMLARESLRSIDTLARYGGEEFVALLPETERSGAYQAAERLRRAVESHEFSSGTQDRLRLSVSVGVATYPRDATSREDLLRRADEALYHAKRLGRNMVCVWGDDHEGLNSQSSSTITWEERDLDKTDDAPAMFCPPPGP